jgi:hypothetical protein
MRKAVVVLGVLALAAAGAHRAEAQFRFGANVSWADDADFGIGARANFGLGSMSKRQPVEGMVTFDYFFPGDNVNYWEASANGVYRFTTSETVHATPYVGAGVVLGHTSVDLNGSVCNITGVDCSNTGVGLNLLGGLRFRAGPRFIPFVEARFEVKDNSQFIITGGAFFGKW